MGNDDQPLHHDSRRCLFPDCGVTGSCSSGRCFPESYGVDDHSGKGRDRDAQENRKRFCKEYIEASYIQIHMFISFFSNSQFANARGLNFCLRPPKKSIPAAPDSETWNASCRQVSPSGAWRSWRANFLGEKSRESAWFRYNWMGLRIWAWLGP